MSKKYTNMTIVIPKNEDSDKSASLRIETNSEAETVSIFKHNWEAQTETIEIPKQFLGDVIRGLENIQEFLTS